MFPHIAEQAREEYGTFVADIQNTRTFRFENVQNTVRRFVFEMKFVEGANVHSEVMRINCFIYR